MRRMNVVVCLAVLLGSATMLLAANPGLQAGSVWMGTAVGNCDSTGTDSGVAPMTVKTILYTASASSDTVTLCDGTNTETMMILVGTQNVSFGEGKTFKKGLYVNSISSGSKLFIYFK